jgi:hypothetical protein
MEKGFGKGFVEALGEGVAFEGHLGDGVFEFGVDEMALAIGAIQDGEAFVVFLFERNVAQGAVAVHVGRFPRHGKGFATFSTPWKKLSIAWKTFSTAWKKPSHFFHGMENFFHSVEVLNS